MGNYAGFVNSLVHLPHDFAKAREEGACIMQDPNKLLAKIVRRLRTIGTDTQLVEVKEAAWKLPESIGETLSAFMNHTGGILILGLSERRGFTPVEGFNARRLHNALLSACDTITPPCRPDSRSRAPKSWPPSFLRSNPT